MTEDTRKQKKLRLFLKKTQLLHNLFHILSTIEKNKLSSNHLLIIFCYFKPHFLLKLKRAFLFLVKTTKYL